jgi:central kinetochore subunit Mis15/CHL4
MAPRKPVRAPTNAPVHDSLRVPATVKSLLKSLIRLSKPALIDLALQWLLEENQATCAPYLASNRNLEEEVDEDYLWSPAESIDELRLTYNRMRFESDIKKRYVVDRILDGDWRRGLSLYQVATIDFQCLAENDKALRWTALKLVPPSDDDDSGQEPLKKRRKTNQAPYPTVSPSTFLRNLQHEISPIVKAHYYLHRLHAPQNLSVVRICVADSPYTNPQSSVQSSLLFTDPTRLIFIALPDSCPYIYVSVGGAAKEAASRTKNSLAARTDITSLKRIVLEEIPKALSKSQQKYALESTSLTARSLSTMLALRGNNNTNAASGAYTIFSKGVVDNSPIDAEETTFAQKVLQACEGEEDAEPDSKVSELSFRPRDQAEKRTVLAEKSINPQMGKSLKSKEERLNLKIAAAARFGVSDIAEKKSESAHSGVATMMGGLDRLQVRLDDDLFSHHGPPLSLTVHNINHHDVDPFAHTSPSDPTPGDLPRQGSARMTLTFQGNDIFLGIRKLVESGAIGIQKLPAWMTGEEAISGGIVRGGIVVRGKGGGA